MSWFNLLDLFQKGECNEHKEVESTAVLDRQWRTRCGLDFGCLRRNANSNTGPPHGYQAARGSPNRRSSRAHGHQAASSRANNRAGRAHRYDRASGSRQVQGSPYAGRPGQGWQTTTR